MYFNLIKYLCIWMKQNIGKGNKINIWKCLAVLPICYLPSLCSTYKKLLNCVHLRQKCVESWINAIEISLPVTWHTKYILFIWPLSNKCSNPKKIALCEEFPQKRYTLYSYDKTKTTSFQDFCFVCQNLIGL